MRAGLDHLPAAKRRELERVARVLFDEFEDAVKTKLSDKRHSQKMASSALTLYSDRIEGGDGNDILVGDAATLKPLIAQAVARLP